MCGIKQIFHEEKNECDCGRTGVRKLLTKQEKIEKLKQYKADLEQELKAANETLQIMTQGK